MKKIGWVVPSFNSEGSGGLKTLHDHIKCLIGQYEQNVYMLADSDKQAKFIIEKNYGELPGVNIYSNYNIEPDQDLLIATWWMTAETVKKTPAKRKAYFVQDLEYLFYPVSDFYLGALEAFSYGFTPITIGTYLARALSENFGIQEAYPLTFGADLNIYKPLPNYEKKKAVCFLYQPEKHRRCPDLGLQALRILKKAKPEVQVYLYGSRPDPADEKRYPMFDNLGLLSKEDCNKLYNICQIGLCFSPTNPSRIPFEMMAAGLPSVDIVHPFFINKDDYGGNVFLAKPADVEIASWLMTAIDSPELMQKQGQKCIEFMKTRDLSVAFDDFRRAIGEITSE